jgi:Flp pilus assembly protein TadD
MCRTEPIDLEQGLALANRAIEIEPTNAEYRDTRGQILLKLGRWAESVADLEVALNGMPDDPSIHQSLALAYDRLGKPALAEFHRQSLASSVNVSP